MRDWEYANTSSLGNHLLRCPFFARKKLLNQVKLPQMCDVDPRKVWERPAHEEVQKVVTQHNYWQPHTPPDTDDD